MKDLSDLEKNVILMIDEVYTSSRIEYDNGKFVGYTEDGKVAKTILAFMVKSVCGHYEDVVSLFPCDNLDAKSLETKCMHVLRKINPLYSIHAVSVDNHVINRSFYVSICGGETLKPFIENPFSPDRRLYLLFEPHSQFEKYFQQLDQQKKFCVPINEANDKITADFNDIVKVYETERKKPLRIAHKLSK